MNHTAPGVRPARADRHGIALAALALTLLCVVVWSALAVTHPHTMDVFFYGSLMALYLSFTLFGAFIVVNRDAPLLGGLLVATGTLRALGVVVPFAAGLAGAGGVAADVIVLLFLVGDISYQLTIMAFPLFVPDGRLSTRPVRVLFWLSAFWAVVLGFRSVADPRYSSLFGVPNPLVHGVWADLYRHLADLLGNPQHNINVARNVGVALLVCNLVVALVRRRRSPAASHRLIEALVPWALWVTAVLLAYYVPIENANARYAIAVFGPAVFLVGLTAAFRRDRELSLDRATRRYLALGAFSVLLFVTLLTVTWLAHTLLPAHDRATGDWWWTVLAALVLGALLRPAGGWAITAVDRYYYGDRARPYQVARGLAERMSRTVNPARIPPLLCATVVDDLGLPAAKVVMDTRGGPNDLAALGEQGPQPEDFPLTYEGARIGVLRVSPRSGQAALDRQDREVLRLLADQASPALASLRLYEDLQASRKRIVLTREEERRRLRHDLHDGLGPALSGLRLQLDAARSQVGEESPVGATLAGASTGIGRAITELRRITDGLAPAALGAEGLTGALRQLAEQLSGHNLRVAVDLAPDPLPQLPAAVEVALYRISGEALNNVVRHSGASTVRLVVRAEDDEVTVEAHDNGAGFPTHSDGFGVGLRSMAERAEELGGSFSAANDSQGAVVRAVFPAPATVEQPG
jgi:signal transduction histidine kinase